jgi:Zn finger protein HypA/HybF involved in hydrogenase expression
MQSTLTERIRELEKQVAEFETWETDKQEYEMAVLQSGTIVYALKSDTPTTKAAHYICAKCYQNRKASLLQPVPRSGIVSTALSTPNKYRCPECNSEFLA